MKEARKANKSTDKSKENNRQIQRKQTYKPRNIKLKRTEMRNTGAMLSTQAMCSLVCLLVNVVKSVKTLKKN